MNSLNGHVYNKMTAHVFASGKKNSTCMNAKTLDFKILLTVYFEF